MTKPDRPKAVGLEKVVRRVIRADGWPVYRTADDNGLEVEQYVDFVRAVLRAIREPDERVLEAMRAQLAERDACSSVTEDGLVCGAACWCQITALAIWQAGIDAMMEEGK